MEAMETIREKHPRARLDGFAYNLKHMSEVRDLASDILKRHPVIHGVLHNAATVDGDFRGRKLVSKEDTEETLAVNAMALFVDLPVDGQCAFLGRRSLYLFIVKLNA